MVVIVKSGPDSVDGNRGVKLAQDMAADLVLLQNGVYFAQGERLKEVFCRKIFVLDDDLRLRGLKDEEIIKDIKKINYDALVDLMAKGEKVVGVF